MTSSIGTKIVAPGNSPVAVELVTNLSRICTEKVQLNTLSIIFVHGLLGHREKSCSVDEDNHLQASSWHQRIKNHVRPKATRSEAPTSIFWPKDFLPEIVPHARIITYGYEAKILELFRSVSQNSVYAISRDMVTDIELLRSDTKEVHLVQQLGPFFDSWVYRDIGP